MALITTKAATATTATSISSSAGLPSGSVLQVKHMWNDNQYAYAVTTSGNDFLDTGEFTTKAANSTFSIVVTLCHGVGDEVNNMENNTVESL